MVSYLLHLCCFCQEQQAVCVFTMRFARATFTSCELQAGDVVLPEPEVRRVTLPSQGARLIIASDGLWDAVKPKTAAHHIRGMQAGKAAGELVSASCTLSVATKSANYGKTQQSNPAI